MTSGSRSRLQEGRAQGFMPFWVWMSSMTSLKPSLLGGFLGLVRFFKVWLQKGSDALQDVLTGLYGRKQLILRPG